MIKLKTCNVCNRKFRSDAAGRLEIVKRKDKGNVEIWVCPKCTPEVKKRLEDLNLIF